MHWDKFERVDDLHQILDNEDLMCSRWWKPASDRFEMVEADTKWTWDGGKWCQIDLRWWKMMPDRSEMVKNNARSTWDGGK